MSSAKPEHKPSVFHAKLGAGGRLVIPAEARQQLHLEEGSDLVIEVDGNGLHIAQLQQTIKQIQVLCRQHVPEGVSVVDELLRERREDAARE